MAGPSDIDTTDPAFGPTLLESDSGADSGDVRLEVGTVLGGRYVIARRLGSGGMGTVYAAQDTLVDQRVALKFVRRDIASDAGELGRLRQEVKLAQSVTNEHVARTFTLEELEGRLFIVMELLEGETLAARIARGPLPLPEASAIARSLLEGLEAAHRRGVTHRDLKPANVMLCVDGRAVLMDFGLARAHGTPIAAPGSLEGAVGGSLTAVGGTPGYIAPEVLRGDPSGPAADLYAMGAVLFEMVVGRPPFAGTTPMELFAAHISEPAPDLTLLRPDVAPAVAQAVRRLLDKEPERRFASASETLAALSPRGRGRRALVVTGSLAALFAVAALGWWRWPASEPEPREPVAPRPARAEVDLSVPNGAIEGQVISWGSGLAVAGAELIFASGGKSVSVRSRADGGFALEAAEAGPLRLQVVTADGYLPYAPAWGVSPIEVVSRPRTRLRGLVLYLRAAVDYEGRVEDEQGRPAAGAQVRLLGTRAGEQSLVPIRDLFVADGQGRFSFRAPDFAVLEARSPGQPPGRASVDRPAQLSHSLVIRLGVPILSPRARITGRVTDQTGAPLAQVVVSAEPLAREGAQDAAAQTETDGAGRFVLDELSGEAYAIVASHAGLSPAVAPHVKVGTDLLLALGGGCVLRGRVADHSGMPVPAFSVKVLRRLGPLRLEPLVGKAVADAQGRFELAGLPPGPVRVLVEAYGFAPDDGSEATLGQAPAEVGVVLGRGGSLVGKVVSARDGKPVALARVSTGMLLDLSTSTVPASGSTITDAQGRFELIGLPAGRRSVVVAAFGHHTQYVTGLDLVEARSLGPIAVTLEPVQEGEEPTLELAGVGAVLEIGDDALLVQRVLAGGGGEAAGLLVGDGVVAVDGRPVTSLGYEPALDAIRGPPGTRVQLQIRRAGRPLELPVERRKIKSR